MPLFGKSKAQKAEQRAAEHHDNAHNDPNTHGAGIGGSRDERGQHDSNTNAFGHNSGSNREGGIGHPHAHDSNAMSQGTGVGAQDYAQPNNALGHNTRDGGAGYQGNGPLGIASGTDTRHHNGHQGGPVDRAEQRVEGAIGARAIQNQVGDKEQEVKAIKAQSAELAEAERLEREAKMHRDRAVAGGAHPANQRLGAGWQT